MATRAKASGGKAKPIRVPTDNFRVSGLGALFSARAIASLIPYARNSRTHSQAQVRQIAALIDEFGFTNPVLADQAGNIHAGHGRVLGAELLYSQGKTVRLPGGQVLDAGTIPVLDCTGWSEAQRRAYVIADNRAALNAGWDAELLGAELTALKAEAFDLGLLGFDDGELGLLLGGEAKTRARKPPDEIPDPGPAVTRPGDIWICGDHRVMCGDSIVAADVERLLAGEANAALLHADPPYGMGKEGDGVENDNLYAAKLDRFQMSWWQTWRPFVANNGSAYIWGNADDLWRLWHAGGLKASERVTMRNEIVWDKDTGMGMNSETHRQFATATERCLFFMLGEQGFGNVNKADFWEGFEVIRAHLEEQVKAAGFDSKDVLRLCGVHMYGHWFTKSQWTMIPEKHYMTLKAAAQGKAFNRPYNEIRQLYDGGTASGGHLAAKQEFYGTRAYFENTHENMRDVWNFPRVQGEDRHGHATPKPVAMIERCVKSSAPVGAAVLEPFCGTGTTLIACELNGRSCRTMELTPAYVDTTVRRWQGMSGGKAVLEATGQTFDDVQKERALAGEPLEA
jgi:DNA modification methylase